MNTKSKTAGYDKYILHTHSIGDWFVYKNTRTGKKIRVKTERRGDTNVIPESEFYSVNPRKGKYFREPVEYFNWYLKEYGNFYNSQFKFELKQVQEKFPEYFI
jgi:signal peptidase I